MADQEQARPCVGAPLDTGCLYDARRDVVEEGNLWERFPVRNLDMAGVHASPGLCSTFCAFVARVLCVRALTSFVRLLHLGASWRRAFLRHLAHRQLS